MVTLKLINRSKLYTSIAKRGSSISDFSKKIGISNPHLSQILNGKRNPSAKTAHKIARELEVDIEDLFSIETNSPQKPLEEVNTN